MSASSASVWTVQLDPPFVEYSTVTYAVDPELLARDNVEVFVPPPVEHVPKLCDAVRLTAVTPPLSGSCGSSSSAQPAPSFLLDAPAAVLTRETVNVPDSYCNR